jgi:MoxR-like ATPase
MHVNVGYPNVTEERAILKLNRYEADRSTNAAPALQTISEEQIFAARHAVLNLHLAPDLEEYLIQLVMATRNPAAYGDDLAGWLEYGASPRATIGLDRCARAHAWLAGRDFVAPEDIQAVAYDVLRHRVILRFEAEAEGVTPDQVVGELIARIAVP